MSRWRLTHIGMVIIRSGIETAGAQLNTVLRKTARILLTQFHGLRHCHLFTTPQRLFSVMLACPIPCCKITARKIFCGDAIGFKQIQKNEKSKLYLDTHQGLTEEPTQSQQETYVCQQQEECGEWCPLYCKKPIPGCREFYLGNPIEAASLIGCKVADDDYTFTVKLCDNEIDDDNERFSSQCLKQMAEMFVGKYGCIGETRIAKIVSTEIVTDENKWATFYERHRWIKATATIPRINETEKLIEQIERGEKQKISVACSVNTKICSICGDTSGNCYHMLYQQSAKG